MDRETELGLVRRAYAKEIVATSGIPDARVETAFTELRREDFLDPGPWLVIGERGDYVPTPSADPAYLYLDHVVGILPERHLNNGQPSLHAKLLAHAGPQEGDHVVHVGAGTGYYTAIMAHLVGRSGKVTAIELDPGLADRARVNLSSYPNVSVICGNGAVVPFDAADVVYVNAGATRPAEAWLDGLAEGGRLILSLTTSRGFMRNDPPAPIARRGAVFRIERRSCVRRCSTIVRSPVTPVERRIGLRPQPLDDDAVHDGAEQRRLVREAMIEGALGNSCALRHRLDASVSLSSEGSGQVVTR
jgi:protein-L-isoaspartate(D-aspartate) O-methyltransferase